MKTQTISVDLMQFKSVWNSKNEKLKKNFSDKVRNIVFFPLQAIVRRIILPSSMYSNSPTNPLMLGFNTFWFGPITESNRFFRSYYTTSKIEVTTPDGVKLSGYHFKHKDARTNDETMIYCQPNGALCEMPSYSWLLASAALRQAPCNFVVFNHRGCGQSQGTAQGGKDLVLDTDSILQHVTTKLKVPCNKVHFYGYSLGGGVSGELKAMHPEINGKYVNERSFASIHKVIKAFFSFILVRKTASLIVKKLGWNLQPSKTFQNIQGEKRIIFEGLDQVIPSRANLATSLLKKNLVSAREIIELNSKEHKVHNPHCDPIEQYASHAGLMPMTQIADFLFGSQRPSRSHMESFISLLTERRKEMFFEFIAKSYQNGGHYFGSGQDAFYNRNGQSLTDAEAFGAIERFYSVLTQA